MTEELDVLRIISKRLRAADVPFMLTGSFALGYYGKPRMTRDLDFVVALMERHVDALVSAFSTDFYIDEDAARSANLILSKLVWARDTGSEMQLRDVRTLIDESVDWPYLKDWAPKLGVAAKLDELSK
jgi:hypothetical protein